MQKTPIAIIGIGCRFPNINNHHEFWDLLTQGRETVAKESSQISQSDKIKPSKRQLANVDQFDADFFDIAAESANLMDPQQRLLLEVAWETFEDAGKIPQDLAGSNTGIFIGINNANYYELLDEEAKQRFDATTGNQRSLAANRLSYFFDFQGTSMAIDTACSSSLVAVDRACRSLWTEESELALAGGINLILTDHGTVQIQEAGLVAADGRCKIFDASADGYVRSDGVGLVLLKSLPQAQADGDRIYAVIQNSAVNHNGRSNGLTAPNLQAQVDLLKKVYQQANIDPASVNYIEAHATGTLIGDALELKAIGRVLGRGRSPENPCYVSSVKTNLGHTETASGIAGLIKTALIAYHQQLPPHLHLQKLNPAIALDKLCLKIPQTLTTITDGDRPFISGVSAFGLGGTNVHAIIQNAPQQSQIQPSSRLPIQIFLISANTQTALQNLIAQYQTLCREKPDIDLETLCCNVSTTRSQFLYRFCTIVSSLAELEKALESTLE
ncbi:MAG: beta-ketoacyl synthase N-terminal-like domain-containing protein, partial [Limnothrix sp.]